MKGRKKVLFSNISLWTLCCKSYIYIFCKYNNRSLECYMVMHFKSIILIFFSFASAMMVSDVLLSGISSLLLLFFFYFCHAGSTMLFDDPLASVSPINFFVVDTFVFCKSTLLSRSGNWTYTDRCGYSQCYFLVIIRKFPPIYQFLGNTFFGPFSN